MGVALPHDYDWVKGGNPASLTVARIARSLRRRRFVVAAEAGGKPSRKRPRALLQYKTDFYDLRAVRRGTRHSNVWEVVAIVALLDAAGYSVDVVDRGTTALPRSAPYEVFIGLGSGYSGRHFAHFAHASRAQARILLATGPRPDVSDALVNDQYAYFAERHGTVAPPMRVFPGLPFMDFVDAASAIVAIGESDQFCADTYRNLHLPLAGYLPGVTGQATRGYAGPNAPGPADGFLCFAGNGFICKGVDLVVEAFLHLPGHKLTICGPNTESAFFDVLGPKIQSATNISYEGFVPAYSRRYQHLVSTHGYTILASSSEGCATSVATTMTSGLIPIVTRECGIDVGDFGHLIDVPRRQRIEAIAATCEQAATAGESEMRERSWATLVDAQKYSKVSFLESMNTALDSVIPDWRACTEERKT